MRVFKKYVVKSWTSILERSCVRFLIIVSVVVFVTMVHLSNAPSESTYSEYLLKALRGPLRYDDPELVRYIQEKILVAPSKEPYNLTSRHAKMYHLDSQIFYVNFLKSVFNQKRNGFFVEAGAMDGQSMSNTLWLEVKQGWTGLLVEPDPSNYIALKRKHRKAWQANSCLSVEYYPKEEKFSSFDQTLSNNRYVDPNRLAMGSMVQEFKNETVITSLVDNETQNSYYLSQCFPLGSLLLALNKTRIDLLSLDVEFAEEQVLRHLDFDKFYIEVIFLEWWAHDKLPWLNKYMSSKGYNVVENRPGDLIFVKKNSDTFGVVSEKGLWRDFQLFLFYNETNPRANSVQ